MKSESELMREVMENATLITNESLQPLFNEVEQPPKRIRRLKLVNIMDAISHPTPPQKFVWDAFLPLDTVTMLSGHGGHGKSLVALMLSIRASQGVQLFGIKTTKCKTLFVSLEDGKDVVRRRLASICKSWNIDPQELNGCLSIVDGTDDPHLFTAETRGMFGTTETYRELANLIKVEKFGLVIVDNASDAFDADEIQRRPVRAFIRSLVKIAKENSCAILLLAHVDKTTSRSRGYESGENYSGSTAWHNSVKSRIYMSLKDDRTLILNHQKSNYGKEGDALNLIWPEDCLPQELHRVQGHNQGFSEALENGRADDDRAISLLKLIFEYEQRKQFCSPGITSRNGVHALLKSDPEFLRLKLKADHTKRIVTHCHRAKFLEIFEYRDSNRKMRDRWTVTASGCAFASISAPSAPSAPASAFGAPCL